MPRPAKKSQPDPSGRKGLADVVESPASPVEDGSPNLASAPVESEVIARFADDSTAPAFLDPMYGWMTPAGVCLPANRQPIGWQDR